jgi:hypothetical protein
VLAGALFGGLAGAFALTVALWLERDPWFTAGLLVGPYFGAPIGAVTAPVLAWLLLRHVPLGKMFVGAALGTTIGGVVGWITTTSGVPPFNALMGAFIGCVVAAITLRYRAHRLEA